MKKKAAEKIQAEVQEWADDAISKAVGRFMDVWQENWKDEVGNLREGLASFGEDCASSDASLKRALVNLEHRIEKLENPEGPKAGAQVAARVAQKVAEADTRMVYGLGALCPFPEGVARPLRRPTENGHPFDLRFCLECEKQPASPSPSELCVPCQHNLRAIDFLWDEIDQLQRLFWDTDKAEQLNRLDEMDEERERLRNLKKPG